MSFLEDLNAAQQEAVKAYQGPVMVIAGAGSGKTRVLTYRVAYLLSIGVRPYEILALTFTNKAANEMRSRIVELVGAKSQEVWMGTFHSTLARILRLECEKIGFGRNFTIYDSNDSLSTIKRIMSSLGLPQQQFSPDSIRSRISFAKNQCLRAKEFGRLSSDFYEEKIVQVYVEYEKKLRANNAMDFDDLLIKPIELFEKNPKTLEKYQLRFKYILIDEYQDTNRTQYRLIKKLAEQHRNICVVGDDAQSIYGFRGADIRNILDFKEDYPDCAIYRLEQNYRSTQKILSVAAEIIRKNREQIEKNLWTKNPEGERVTLLECEDEKEEGYFIAQKIRQESTKLKLDLNDFAILYRTNAQSRSLEDALRRTGIPYTIVGGLEFYRRKEVKDLLAYLRLIVNPRDDESFFRIINYPSRGIGEATVKKLRTLAARQGLCLVKILPSVERDPKITGRTKEQINGFSELIKKYSKLKETISASELARTLVDDLGILAEFKRDGTPEALSRRENVQELLSAITEFSAEWPGSTLANFLEEVALVSDIDTWEDKRNAVTLMTLHSAKGLEFSVVVITGLEEGLFPLHSSESDERELEEERRLFYVGVTRTMKKLYLSYARSRLRHGEVSFPIRSRFVDEIPQELLLVEQKGMRRWQRLPVGVPGTFPDDHGTIEESQRGESPGITLDFRLEETGLWNGYEKDSEELNQLRVGCVVEHDTFGRGQILVLDGRGETAKAIVRFDDFGRKHLLLKYAHLKLVSMWSR